MVLLAVLVTALPAFAEADAVTVAFFDVAFLGDAFFVAVAVAAVETLALAGRFDDALAAGVVR